MNWRLTTLLLWMLILTACSSTQPVLNQPLVKPAVDSDVGDQPTNRSSELVLVLTFSGGGTRAAALSYGVLKALRDIEVKGEEKTYNLLDEVDLISSVSGGSFTAAYYGLYGKEIFNHYESRFLKQPVQTNLLTDWLFKPSNWLRLFADSFNRSDLAAEFYEKRIFGTKRFGDMRRDGPRIVINATDVAAGNAFSFTPSDFNWICSDLNTYPVGRAVAASAAVPVLFSPIVLRNYPGCAIRPDSADETLLNRNAVQALGLRKYQDKERYPYLHLVDGGVSDNLGIRALLHVVAQNNQSFWQVLKRSNLEHARNVVFIAVNASDSISPEIAKKTLEPDPSLMISAVTTIQSRRYNLDTLDILEHQFPVWARQIKQGRCLETDIAHCSDIRFFLLELGFDDLSPQEHAELGAIATALELPPEEVDQIIEVGERLMRTAPELPILLKALEGKSSLP